MFGSAGWLGVAVAATELAIDVVDVGSSGLLTLFVSKLLDEDEDARISVDCVRNESCEFADGVMREYDVVDVSVESDVNERDVVLFCDGKLMIAELVVAMLVVVPLIALVVVVPLTALVVVVVPLTALVVVEFPTLVVMVDVLHRINSVPGYDSWQDNGNTYSEVVVLVLLSAVVVTIGLVDVVVIVWLPDTVVIVVALESVVVTFPVSVVVAIELVVAVPFAEPVEVAMDEEQPGPIPKLHTPDEVALPESDDVTVALTESVVDEADPEPENVVVAEALPESVEDSEPVADAEPDVEDEQPSPMPRMQTPDEVALEAVPLAESVVDALTEPVVVAEPLEESVDVALTEDEPDESVAVDDALSLLLEQPSPRPRMQTPLEVALAELDESDAEAELDESVAVAVPDTAEESVAVAELDEPVAPLSVADADDEVLSLLEQSPRPRIQIPPLLDVLVGSAELVADDSEADAEDVAESDVVPALLASVDDATDEVETGVALDGSVVLAEDALALEDAALLEQLPSVIPKISTQPPDELALDEEAEPLDDGAAEVDAEEDAEDDAALDVLAPSDVDVAGTSAVVPDREVELEQPCVIPKSGMQSPPCPSFAARRQRHG